MDVIGYQRWHSLLFLHRREVAARKATTLMVDGFASAFDHAKSREWGTSVFVPSVSRLELLAIADYRPFYDRGARSSI